MSACSGPAECTRPEQADVDVAVEPDTHLVGRGRAPTAAERRLLDAVAGQALLALRNQQVTTEAADARRRADATELRSALLSAVGHDLRTPLVSIKAAAGSLCDPDLRLSDADRDETDRVRIDLPDDLPEVLADPGLLERVVANLVDNALRHGGGARSPCAAAPSRRDEAGRLPGTGPGLRRAPASSPRRTASSCASSTPSPGSPRVGPRSCSPRSNGSVTASRAGSASASASPAASPRPWAGR